MSLTAFDILVLLLIGLGAIAGVMRGFVTEILSLIAWVAAIFALRLFYEPASAMAAEMIGTEAGGAILAFVLVFLVTFIGFRFIAKSLGSRTRTSVIGPIDRLLGLGFGALKGLLGASLLFLLVTLAFDMIWGADEPKPEWLEASQTYPLMKLSSKAIVDFVEERRKPEPQAESRAAEKKRDPADDGGGYSSEQRGALDEILDQADNPDI